MRTWLAAIAAIAIQPFVFIALLLPGLFHSSSPMNGLGIVVTAVAAVAAAVTVLLGVPAFWVLRRFGREGWRSLGAVGAALGVLPVAFFWPRHFAGYSSGQNWHGHDVDLYVDGMPTVYAWLIYAEKVLTFGLHGLIGALVFYAVLRRLSRGPRLIKG